MQVGDWLGLSGQVVAVTGAASGIGAAVAAGFLAAGARVALLDHNAEGLAAQVARLDPSGQRVWAWPCDVAQRAAVQDAAQALHQHWGGADVLVNNAGLLRAAPLAEVTETQWRQALDVNLQGYLWCAQAFGAAMRERGQGAIVHVASISGLFPQTASGAYSASKAGVLLLSKQLAAEWGPMGVRSNAVCPGMIRTPLSARFYEDPEFEARRARLTASRRIGEPEDIADPVLFLASRRAGYLNGAELVVDGGLSCMLMDLLPRPGFNHTGARP